MGILGMLGIGSMNVLNVIKDAVVQIPGLIKGWWLFNPKTLFLFFGGALLAFFSGPGLLLATGLLWSMAIAVMEVTVGIIRSFPVGSATAGYYIDVCVDWFFALLNMLNLWVDMPLLFTILWGVLLIKLTVELIIIETRLSLLAVRIIIKLIMLGVI